MCPFGVAIVLVWLRQKYGITVPLAALDGIVIVAPFGATGLFGPDGGGEALPLPPPHATASPNTAHAQFRSPITCPLSLIGPDTAAPRALH
jgi:hypothetical protein